MSEENCSSCNGIQGGESSSFNYSSNSANIPSTEDGIAPSSFAAPSAVPIPDVPDLSSPFSTESSGVPIADVTDVLPNSSDQGIPFGDSSTAPIATGPIATGTVEEAAIGCGEVNTKSFVGAVLDRFCPSWARKLNPMVMGRLVLAKAGCIGEWRPGKAGLVATSKDGQVYTDSHPLSNIGPFPEEGCFRGFVIQSQGKLYVKEWALGECADKEAFLKVTKAGIKLDNPNILEKDIEALDEVIPFGFSGSICHLKTAGEGDCKYYKIPASEFKKVAFRSTDCGWLFYDSAKGTMKVKTFDLQGWCASEFKTPVCVSGSSNDKGINRKITMPCAGVITVHATVNHKPEITIPALDVNSSQTVAWQLPEQSFGPLPIDSLLVVNDQTQPGNTTGTHETLKLDVPAIETEATTTQEKTFQIPVANYELRHGSNLARNITIAATEASSSVTCCVEVQAGEHEFSIVGPTSGDEQESSYSLDLIGHCSQNILIDKEETSCPSDSCP